MLVTESYLINNCGIPLGGAGARITTFGNTKVAQDWEKLKILKKIYDLKQSNELQYQIYNMFCFLEVSTRPVAENKFDNR